jgi:uncharacterized protein
MISLAFRLSEPGGTTGLTVDHSRANAMNLSVELSDAEIDELNAFLGRVKGGDIPNAEALDGFFAALACCPDLVMPSEYLRVIQSGATSDGDLVFENMDEARRFTELTSRQWNHVNQQLDREEVYLPLLLEDINGDVRGTDWAKGFLKGTHLRHSIWAELFEDEETGGPLVPIMALAYENHPDPEIRPFKTEIDKTKRNDLLVAAAAGVMRLHRHFLKQRNQYTYASTPFVRDRPKTGRNEPCPCGSGKKFKKCCGSRSMLH